VAVEIVTWDGAGAGQYDESVFTLAFAGLQAQQQVKAEAVVFVFITLVEGNIVSLEAFEAWIGGD